MTWMETPRSRRRILIGGAGVLAGAAAATALNPFTKAEAQQSPYHQPRHLAGLRRRRDHPRRLGLLHDRVHDALLARRPGPAFAGPRQLGVHRPLRAEARLQRRVRPDRRHTATGAASGPPRSPTAPARTASTGSGRSTSTARSCTPPPTPPGPGPATPNSPAPTTTPGCSSTTDDTMYVALRQHRDLRRAALGRRQDRGPQPEGLRQSGGDRRPGGRPVLQDQRQLLHIPTKPPNGQYIFKVLVALGPLRIPGRSCWTCRDRSPAAASPTRAASSRLRTVPGTT